MHPARLFIMCGLPGAGKTMRATELAERFRVVRMSPDDWMERFGVDIWDERVRQQAEAVQGELTMELLRTGSGVVVEWGTRTRSARDGLRTQAIRAGALVHLEFLDAAVDILWDRIRTRGREQLVGSRAIELDDLRAWAETIERPTPDELDTYDPMPPVRAGARPGSPAYPYGSWQPQSRPR